MRSVLYALLVVLLGGTSPIRGLAQISISIEERSMLVGETVRIPVTAENLDGPHIVPVYVDVCR